MPIGVHLQLFDASGTALASLTGVQAVWWDVGSPSDINNWPQGKTTVATTDVNGYLDLDLSNVTGLTVGQSGFLQVYKLDATDHQDSLTFSGKVATSTIASGVDMYYYEPGDYRIWSRNPSWLTMPSVSGLEKVAGLHAVYPGDAQFCALKAAGAYTVDWGDGSATEDIATGVTAEHVFDYTNVNLANTDGPVTFTDTGDLVNRTAHGHANGDEVRFYNIVSTTGLTEGQTYYVVNAATDTFQVSETVGGTAIALTTNGSATLLPYKQAIVTIVPNGGTLTSIDLNLKHSTSSHTLYSSGWLDLAIEGVNLTSLVIGAGSQNVNHRSLERTVLTGSNGITSAAFLFEQCTALRSVYLNLPACTNFSSMFNYTAGLEHIEYINCSAGTNFSNMFKGCTALRSIPVLDTALGTNMLSMFDGCTSLRSIPLIDTGSVVSTGFYSMFSGCYSLVSVPKLDTAGGTGTPSMFLSCRSLLSVPFFDLSAVTTASGMFDGCLSLRVVPPLNMPLCTIFSNMFDQCSSLEVAPLINTSGGTAFNNMFQVCYSLREVPQLNTAAGTSFSSMFLGCSALQTVPLLDLSAATSVSSMFDGCTSLVEVPAFNAPLCTLFASMFNACTNLKTVGKMNTPSGTSFASMFAGCTALRSVPLINTSSGTTFDSMFINCTLLSEIPLLDTGLGTDFDNMFQGCSSLRAVPALDVSSMTTCTNMFASCASLQRCEIVGIKATISFSYCSLSAAALDEIYTNLATVTSKTITVSNNFGVSGDTPTIATAKGWSVTG